MGDEEQVCNLGTFKVVDLKQHPGHGYIAFLDMRFDVVGTALESHLTPIVDRTEGVEEFVSNVGVEVQSGLVKPGEANAKVFFDGTVQDLDRARVCLDLFIDAITVSLTNLDDAIKAELNYDWSRNVEAGMVVSSIPDRFVR